MPNATPSPPAARKRVVLKVWPHDGTLCDNAFDIEWLERQGWTVVCSEKLGHDPATGACEVLFLLEWQNASASLPLYPTPTPPGAQPIVESVIDTGDAIRVILSCSTTRGRLIVRQLHPLEGPNVPSVVIGPAMGTHAPATAGDLVPIELIGLASTAGPRIVGVYCVNDADPYNPTISPTPGQSAKGYPEAPPAVVRVDALLITAPPSLAAASVQSVVQDFPVPAGEARAFYIQLGKD